MRPNTKQRAKEDRLARKDRFAFSMEFPLCWICGSVRNLQIHEIVGGAGRRWGYANREAWIQVCQTCHLERFIHDGERWDDLDKLVLQYALKQFRDPDWYDREELNVRRGRAPGAISEEEVRLALTEVLEVIHP